MIQEWGGREVEGDQIGFGWMETTLSERWWTLEQARVIVNDRPVWRRLINGT